MGNWIGTGVDLADACGVRVVVVRAWLPLLFRRAAAPGALSAARFVRTSARNTRREAEGEGSGQKGRARTHSSAASSQCCSPSAYCRIRHPLPRPTQGLQRPPHTEAAAQSALPRPRKRGRSHLLPRGGVPSRVGHSSRGRAPARRMICRGAPALPTAPRPAGTS